MSFFYEFNTRLPAGGIPVADFYLPRQRGHDIHPQTRIPVCYLWVKYDRTTRISGSLTPIIIQIHVHFNTQYVPIMKIVHTYHKIYTDFAQLFPFAGFVSSQIIRLDLLLLRRGHRPLPAAIPPSCPYTAAGGDFHHFA